MVGPGWPGFTPGQYHWPHSPLFSKDSFFAGFYSEASQDWLDGHRIVGDLFLTVVLIVLLSLAYAARFPGGLKMEPLTWVLAVLWVVQWAFGNWTEDARWLAILHISNAFLVFGYTVFLTGKAHRAVRGR